MSYPHRRNGKGPDLPEHCRFDSVAISHTDDGAVNGRDLNLEDLKILALDCQATGVNPKKGQLLEIGWIADCAASPGRPQPAVEAYLLSPAFEKPLPPAVSRITGISNESAAHALPEGTVWQNLAAAAKTTVENQPALCPAVIHFARFEAPFLQQLHLANSGPERPFPFQIICTHAIAVRLLPDLPRRSIRALAGYFGHSTPELRRSADHVLATLSIWKSLVELLKTRCKIYDLLQLTQWLAATDPPRRSKRCFPIDSGIHRAIPEMPGIYRMRRANADVLYIGKAKSLKQRVNSYFRGKAAHSEHVLEMLTQALDIDYFPTESALEAALLESDEIKRHDPPYNIALRSGERELVFLTRDLKRYSTICDESFCLGPLPGGKRIDALIDFEGWLANGMRLKQDCEDEIGSGILGFSWTQPPSIQCLQEGFHLFRSRHLDRLINQTPLRVVTALGAKLWKDRLAAEAHCESDGDMEAEEQSTAVEKIWTPERIAAAIEGILLHSAQLMRRTRWFCLLSESTLAWARADHPEILNAIVLESGAVAHRGDLDAGEEPPVPPGSCRSFRVRRKNLDLITYDRMRVLTTELRRLLCQGRKVEIRLGPKVRLTCSELTKALQWV